jgi:hypothetical protein
LPRGIVAHRSFLTPLSLSCRVVSTGREGRVSD